MNRDYHRFGQGLTGRGNTRPSIPTMGMWGNGPPMSGAWGANYNPSDLAQRHFLMNKDMQKPTIGTAVGLSTEQKAYQYQLDPSKGKGGFDVGMTGTGGLYAKTGRISKRTAGVKSKKRGKAKTGGRKADYPKTGGMKAKKPRVRISVAKELKEIWAKEDAKKKPRVKCNIGEELKEIWAKEDAKKSKRKSKRGKARTGGPPLKLYPTSQQRKEMERKRQPQQIPVKIDPRAFERAKKRAEGMYPKLAEGQVKPKVLIPEAKKPGDTKGFYENVRAAINKASTSGLYKRKRNQRKCRGKRK